MLMEETNRDALRFLWLEENDVQQLMVNFRIRIHVFGAKLSPGDATFTLQRAAYIDATGLAPATVATIIRSCGRILETR